MEESITLDEVIINIVRDNKCLYDKADRNYKNINQKKNVWRKIALELTDIYNVDISAENVEKRWSTLRDMFSREERKKKIVASSESDRNESKEWHLYQPLLFLSSHIAHRRTQESLIKKVNKVSNSQPVCLNQICSQIVQPSKEHRCETALQEGISRNVCSTLVNDHIYDKPQVIDDNAQSHSESITRPLSSCSSPNSLPSTPTDSKGIKRLLDPTSKNVSEMDDFAEYKRVKSAQFDEQLVQTSTTISNAMNTVSTLIANMTNYAKDGYMFAIEEGLKYVPGKIRTQCIIEVLQVIQKYEVRE